MAGSITIAKTQPVVIVCTHAYVWMNKLKTYFRIVLIGNDLELILNLESECVSL